MKPARTTLVLAVVSTLVAFSGSASADSLGKNDAKRDVRSIAGTDIVNGSGPSKPAPSRTLADITTMTVIHGQQNIRITTSYRDLAKIGPEHAYIYRIHTPSKRSIAFAFSGPGNWAGEQDEVFGIETESGSDYACPGLSRSMNFQTNKTVLVIPRSCLGNPSWVRVGQMAFTRSSNRIFYDDALAKGGPYKLFAVLGPKVFP